MIIYLLVQMSDMYQSSARQSAISSRGLSPKKGKKKVKSKDNADQLGNFFYQELKTCIIKNIKKK